MRYVVDIDGTICDPGDTDATRYTDATPIRSRIDKINKLYDEGHYIVYLTARGMGRFNNSRMIQHLLLQCKNGSFRLAHFGAKNWASR